MSNSSQQTDYITISDEDLYSSTTDTIVITGSGDGAYTLSSGDTINFNDISIGDITLNSMNQGTSITSPSISTITINDPDAYTSSMTFNWGDNTEWKDAFPDWNRVQDMCKKYPGLEIALRNFRTIYTLVKDDYDNAKDQE